MDPLSITLAIATLLKTCYAIGTGLKEIRDAADFANTKVKALLSEVESFVQVTEMMKNTLEQEEIRNTFSVTGHIGNHWNSLATSLLDCQTTLLQLNETLEKANKTVRLLDETRRHYRLKAASDEIAVYQQQIRSYRETLQLSLQTIILWNQVTSKSLTDQVLPNLDEIHQTIRKIASDIDTRIASLESSIEANRDVQLRSLGNLRSTIQTAATVVSSTSTVLGITSETDSLFYYGSDFGDCFPTTQNEVMQRWVSSNTVYEYEAESSPSKSIAKGKGKAGDVLQEIDGGSDAEHTDSDDELEMGMIRSLIRKSEVMLNNNDLKEAERLIQICSSRLSTLTIATKHMVTLEHAVHLTLRSIYYRFEKWENLSVVLLDNISKNRIPKGTIMALDELAGLAFALFKQNKNIEALLYGRKAFRGFRKLGSTGAKGSEATLNLLINICRATGDVDDADSYAALLSEIDESAQMKPAQQTVSNSTDIAVSRPDLYNLGTPDSTFVQTWGPGRKITQRGYKENRSTNQASERATENDGLQNRNLSENEKKHRQTFQNQSALALSLDAVTLHERDFRDSNSNLNTEADGGKPPATIDSLALKLPESLDVIESRHIENINVEHKNERNIFNQKIDRSTSVPKEICVQSIDSVSPDEESLGSLATISRMRQPIEPEMSEIRRLKAEVSELDFSYSGNLNLRGNVLVIGDHHYLGRGLVEGLGKVFNERWSRTEHGIMVTTVRNAITGAQIQLSCYDLSGTKLRLSQIEAQLEVTFDIILLCFKRYLFQSFQKIHGFYEQMVEANPLPTQVILVELTASSLYTHISERENVSASMIRQVVREHAIWGHYEYDPVTRRGLRDIYYSAARAIAHQGSMDKKTEEQEMAKVQKQRVQSAKAQDAGPSFNPLDFFRRSK